MRFTIGQIDHPQILVAHIGHEASLGRDLRVDHVVAGIQLARRGVGRGQRIDVELAADGKQQLLAVRRPLVTDDAAQACGALAFAARLLGIGQLFAVGFELFRIHQHVRPVVPELVFPQIQLELVVRARAQKGHAAAVRRNLQATRRRAGKTATVENAFNREFVGHGRQSHHRQGGKKEGAHGYFLGRRVVRKNKRRLDRVACRETSGFCGGDVKVARCWHVRDDGIDAHMPSVSLPAIPAFAGKTINIP